MPITFNPRSSLSIWLPEDAGIPEQKRPVFVMRRPTVGAVLQMHEIFEDSSAPPLDVIKTMIGVLEDHLLETRNLPRNTIRDCLTAEECPVLMKAFIDAAAPGGDDLKNSDWPRTSRPEESAENAPLPADASIRRAPRSHSKLNVRRAAESAVNTAPTAHSQSPAARPG